MIVQPILHGVGIGLFVGGAGVSIGVIVATIAPQWQRIFRLALGHVERAALAAPIRAAAEAMSL